MAIQRKLTVFLAVALIGTSAGAVFAQDAAASRGTVKVRPRFFNPFSVEPSRLSLNPFGGFTVAASSAVVASSEASSGDQSGETLAVGSAVRPPFRPPVRSPFRPPPRGPFIPFPFP